ncbi:uncharacterized protein DUF1801 [Glaciihabitans tibetensis]|uniref:Uncharacterized protein DUF1801 n=1 Tax=Glaciihabitans tibetensis TaxID=1266600 RepID=A0A2T0VIU5_9MICO|nr:DUF1801 domain-containing protein [Glaciihabitans tibetensis]PRY70005.1 uncharacterized protein DUF1801 [Glaciihabitans tibetensis]
MAAKFSTVEDFLAAQSEAGRAQVEALREIVLTCTPGVQEHIKWNSPSYYIVPGEDRVTVNAHGAGPVRLVLHAGATTPEDKSAAPSFAGDPHGLLTWHSNIRASLTGGDLDGIAAAREHIAGVLRSWFLEVE